MLDLAGPYQLNVVYPNVAASLSIDEVRGLVQEIVLLPDFGDGTSMDVTIATTGHGPPAKTILDVTGITQAVTYRPREAIQDINGSDITGAYSAGMVIFDGLSIDITGADGDTLNVWFLISD